MFRAISTFFLKRKKSGDGKLTQRELEKDFKKLEHGKASGEIIIRNEMPREAGGERTVVDEAE